MPFSFALPYSREHIRTHIESTTEKIMEEPVKIAFDPAKLKLVDPKLLIKDKNNRNKHPQEQIDRFCKLLQKYGMRWPILVSEQTGVIKAGEGRLLAALQLKMPLVLVSYQEFESEEVEYGFGISDNAIASWAELDIVAIQTDIMEFEGFDSDLLGIRNLDYERVPEEPENSSEELDIDSFDNFQHTCPKCNFGWNDV